MTNHAALVGAPDDSGHAAGRALAAVGKEARGIGIGAQSAAMDILHARALQRLAREKKEVGEPLARYAWCERGARPRVAPGERVAHVRADFEHVRADAGAEVGNEVARLHRHAPDR